MHSTLDPEVSVVIPVHNEAANVIPLAQEIAAALVGRRFEILFVNDASIDSTAQQVFAARVAGIRQIRLITHERRSGQSAAVATGMRLARAPWVVTLDGDRQDDPAEVPKFLAARDEPANEGVGLFIGNRVNRRDNGLRRLSSRVANGVRGGLLNDATPDSGCGLKLIHRETFMQLPRFDHMHRFLPALFINAGKRVVSIPVSHRPRVAGQSKYGLFDRLWVGIADLFGVMWLNRRTGSQISVRED
ncbi:MAG: glycosyltransferase [Steroidobacteraceae bacterium]